MMNPNDTHERISFINQPPNSQRQNDKKLSLGGLLKCCILVIGLVLLMINVKSTGFQSKWTDQSLINEDNRSDVDTTKNSQILLDKNFIGSSQTNEGEDSENVDGETNSSFVPSVDDDSVDENDDTEEEKDEVNKKLNKDDDSVDEDDDTEDEEDDEVNNKSGKDDDSVDEDDDTEDEDDDTEDEEDDEVNNKSGKDDDSMEEEDDTEDIVPEKNDEKKNIPQQNESESGMKYAWLMSFPNSGTSYTLTIVRSVSQLNTATNYRKNVLDKKEAKEYLKAMDAKNENHLLTPFISIDTNLSPPTSGFTLTKTHCGGRCTSCAPSEYLESTDIFLKNCLKMGFDVKNKEKDIERHNPTYDPALIEKAVHLFRSPFDNAISRFHCHRKKRDDQYKLDYPKDTVGFHAYCKEQDEMFLSEEKEVDKKNGGKHHVDTSKVPCHGEFHRYIAWHENVLRIVRKELSIPTHTMYYEDYDSDYEGTIDKLMTFLELPKTEHRSPFHMSDYSDHFSKEEKNAAISMMKNQASDELWEIISSRYGY